MTGITDQLKQILDQLKLLPVELDESGKPEAVKTKIEGKVNVDTVDQVTKNNLVMAVTKVDELVKITDKVNVDTIDVLTNIENKINVETVDTVTKVDSVAKVDELSKLATSEEEPLWTQVKSSETNPVHVKFGEGLDPIRVRWEDQEVKVRNPIIEGDIPIPMPLIIAGIETDPLHPNKDNGMKVEIIKSVVLPVDVENEIQIKEPITVQPPEGQPFEVQITNEWLDVEIINSNPLAVDVNNIPHVVVDSVESFPPTANIPVTVTNSPTVAVSGTVDVDVKNSSINVNIQGEPVVEVSNFPSTSNSLPALRTHQDSAVDVHVQGTVLLDPSSEVTAYIARKPGEVINIQPVTIFGPRGGGSSGSQTWMVPGAGSFQLDYRPSNEVNVVNLQGVTYDHSEQGVGGVYTGSASGQLATHNV